MKLIKAFTAIAVSVAASSAFATLEDPCCHILNDSSVKLDSSTYSNFDYDVTGDSVADFSVSTNIGKLKQYHNGLGINDGHAFEDSEIESDNGSGVKEIITVSFTNTATLKNLYLGGFNYGTSIFAGDRGPIEFIAYDASDSVIATDSLTYRDGYYSHYDIFDMGDIELSYFTLNATRDTDFILAAICYEEVAEVPVPAAAWLFGSAVAGLAGMRRRK